VGPTSARLLRAAGVVGAVCWLVVALWRQDAWPTSGLVALAATVAAALLLRSVAARLPALVLAAPRPAFVASCAAVAAAVSWWVLSRTLGDRPLSIDAGIYLLQAHAMAHGHFGMPEPVPAQAFGDRFLLDGPDGRFYGIFPPGWPLAIVPFAWLGRPMLVGPAIAAATVVAQAWLGRTLARAAGDDADGELATRVAILLSLTSVGRALETADLLSHAFVALLACIAIAAALDVRRDGRVRALVLGGCVAWVAASRMLDGVVLGLVVAVAFGWSRPGWRSLGWAALGAAPLALLLVLEQHAATGAWLLPTQSSYFARSDWPSTCHRLGFGADIGCSVEHPGPVSRLGGHGFGLPQALAVVKERAGSVGEEVLGFAPLALVAFVPLVVTASMADAIALGFVLALTLAYGLFYYGNALFFGARHLYPTAPFLWWLVARGALRLPGRSAAGRLDRAHTRGLGLAVVVIVAVVAARGPWKERLAGAAEFQSTRSDLEKTLAEHHVDRGILKTHDYTAFAAAFDPWSAPEDRIVALDDGSGLLDLRRAHPQLPVLLSLPGNAVGKLYPVPPAPGVLVELERAWPAFVRPRGLATRQLAQPGASGGFVLLVSHATPGADLRIPFDVSVAGTYALRVDGVASPTDGDYDLVLDGSAMGAWHGYAEGAHLVKGTPVVRTLSPGRHVLTAACTGKEPGSGDYDAHLDAIVGTPETAPAGP
jgi:hypothetical protein